MLPLRSLVAFLLCSFISPLRQTDSANNKHVHSTVHSFCLFALGIKNTWNRLWGASGWEEAPTQGPGDGICRPNVFLLPLRFQQNLVVVWLNFPLKCCSERKAVCGRLLLEHGPQSCRGWRVTDVQHTSGLTYIHLPPKEVSDQTFLFCVFMLSFFCYTFPTQVSVGLSSSHTRLLCFPASSVSPLLLWTLR